MLVSYKNEVFKYKILQVLEFNSSRFFFMFFGKIIWFFLKRKRQSVIVQDTNKKIILYCKGADSIIEKRLNMYFSLFSYKRLNIVFRGAVTQEIKNLTWKNLEKYANTGLRTLVIAKREIPESLYETWSQEYLVTRIHFSLSLILVNMWRKLALQ